MPARPLIKALTDAGAGSRRGVAHAIHSGAVIVNGETAESFNQPVDPDKDRITLNGQSIDLKRVEKVCLMLNKPEGYLSTMRDEQGRRTVIDLLPQQYRNLRLYPAGRLDKDSTGLLLLTNDGDLTYRLTHPRFEYEKEYLLLIKGKLKTGEKRRLEEGILLKDGITSPTSAKEVVSLPPFHYSITIHEGRKRQVRRMFEALGHPVITLKRVRLGSLELGDLPEGQTRRLSTRELARLSEDKSRQV